MRCRSCGHDNRNKSKGPCGNCGFKLDDQNEPRSVQREALQKPLGADSRVGNSPPPDLVPVKKHHSGIIGIAVFITALLVTIYIVRNFDRAEYQPEIDMSEVLAQEEELPGDSLPLMLGTEIVYAFNDEGTSAAPRTNVNLSLIPEGTTVSFLALGSLSIQPVVNYMQQKINGNDFRYLEPDSLFCWTDTTKTSYSAIPILKPVPSPEMDSTAVQPVELKIVFTEDWLRFMVEEYNTDIAEPVPGLAFNRRTFMMVLDQVDRTINRRNTDERPVHITVLFPGDITIGQAVEISDSVEACTDTLGYQGFNLKWVNVSN
ncbi:hypothetical protein CSA37_04830 [Candidatus Fermentibacteria bacterium]|nr:MAG: hypothetical protein CSA37_04830 [Candidatus Fermentibacteria bacterium]